MHDNDRTWTPVTVGMVVYPGFTQLDLAGPYEVFARMPETRVTLVAASVEPSRSDMGLAIVPDTGFADAPPLDIVFVPGGPGQQKAMEEERLIGFLREREASAREPVE
jgi:cyclohexyl-isocyanide hydratase